jgi:hypothetical protein
LVGKKTLIPGPDAKPEEAEAFYSKLRPAKADDYEFKMGEKPDAEFVKAFRESAHFAGLSKVQTSRLVEKLTPVLEARAKAQIDAAAARDTEFETLVKSTLGDGHEKKVERVKTAIKELVPESVRAFADRLDNNSLALVVAFSHSLLEKYAGEDDFKGGAGGGSGAGASGGTDKDSLVKELHTLYATEAWTNFQHPDHDKTRKRIEEIMAAPALK